MNDVGIVGSSDDQRSMSPMYEKGCGCLSPISAHGRADLHRLRRARWIARATVRPSLQLARHPRAVRKREQERSGQRRDLLEEEG